MSSPDPFLTAAREIVALSVADMLSAVRDLDAEGLNWRPDAPETNSIAVYVRHSLSSCLDWLCIAVDAERPARHRPEEFLSSFQSEEEASNFIQATSAAMLQVLGEAVSVEWSERLDWLVEQGEPIPTRAYALIHAVEHLREHVGHIQLTRQLWEIRKT